MADIVSGGEGGVATSEGAPGDGEEEEEESAIGPPLSAQYKV